ncbi:response regulator [Oceanicella sp. SM1341]|uniref:response regulator n=1 Tax=Oceanicella sp. SM1341 TaxID=1548889 RepID=UPI00130067C9|nr:response regulator [Oceanicella sp. SM1341]
MRESPVQLSSSADMLGVAIAERQLSCLLVDDSRFDRRRVRYVAERSGVDVRFLEATTIAEARDALDSQPIDFILLDNFLPDGQGLGLALDLSERAIPVIMLSGQDENGLADAAIWAGMDEFVQKDRLSPELFAEVVRALVQRGRTAPLHEVHGGAEEPGQFARDCVAEMQPPISRLCTLTREMRHHIGGADVVSQHRILSEMDELCGALSDYLSDIRKNIRPS